ncbi:MAG: hypothetical protein AABZ08_02840 [Planctomycetota bacterium]
MRRVLLVATVVLPVLSGCQAMYFLTPEKGKPVKAEYTKIGTQKVAVVVWADRQTLDVDPQARRRICDAIVYHMKKNLEKATFVSGRDVETLQEKSGLDWEQMTNAEIGKKLKCEVVIRVDLLEYTARGSVAQELRKGRVRGTINVYECGVGSGDDASYHTDIACTYPKATDKPVNEMSDGDLIRETVVEFGQEVAHKFYDHEVSYRGPGSR